MILHFTREPLEDTRPLTGVRFGGMKKGESIIDYLKEDEINYIWNTFKDPLKLIDTADNVINNRMEQTPIKYPFKYVLKIADNQFWPENYTKGKNKHGY